MRQNLFDLTGKSALVTGGNSGLGLGFATGLAKAGANVAIWGQRDRQIQVVERSILPEEMAGFDEAFLTGTAAEVTPIAEIGPYRFQPGQICQALMDDFARATRA